MVVIDRLGALARDVVDGNDAFVRRHVGQHQAPDQVADGVDVRFGRSHPAVDFHEAALDFDLRRFEADVLDVGRATGGDEKLIELQLFGLTALRPDGERDAVVGDLDRSGVEARLRDDFDPAPGETAFESGADVAILERHYPGQVFEQRDVHSEVVEKRGELGADRAGPDDGDRLRQIGLGRDVVRGDDPPAVGDEPGKALDPAARREDNVRSVQDALPAGAGGAVLTAERDSDSTGSLQTASAANPGDLVLVDQTAQAGPHPLHDLVATAGHLFVVEAGLAFKQNPELLGLLETRQELGRLDQRFGWNATDVQAGPTDLGLLDERYP